MNTPQSIHKVICPSDLSPAAKNATLYAAQFCQLIGAELELIYIEPLWKQLLLLNAYSSQPFHSDNVEAIARELKQISDQIHTKYDVRCTSDIQYASSNIGDVMKEKCLPGVMAIVGTNGADKLVQRIFGSVTFRLTKALPAPVLVIPEGVEFEPVREIIYAWDYHPQETCVACLAIYANDLKSKLVFLHVSTHETEISKDVFRAVTGSMKRKLKEKVDTVFTRLFASRLRLGLNNNMKERKGAILAISYRNGSMLKKFFRKDEGTGTLFHYPMLVMHSTE